MDPMDKPIGCYFKYFLHRAVYPLGESGCVGMLPCPLPRVNKIPEFPNWTGQAGSRLKSERVLGSRLNIQHLFF
jgi:hypothetical protein